MQKRTAREFTGTRAWEAVDIERIADATIRLHWTNAPYKWHVNDGPEVFVVLDGAVDMHVRDNVRNGDQNRDQTRVLHLEPGDIFHAEEGEEHMAHPCGEARILVIEQAGSV